MAELDAKAARLVQLRADIARAREESKLEEQKQMEIFSKTTSELNTLRNPDSSTRPSSKLEGDLALLQTTLEKRVVLLHGVQASAGVSEATLSAWMSNNQDLKQRFRKLEKLKVRQPPPVPLILQLEELEVVRSDLQKSILDMESVGIPQLRAKIEAKEKKNHLKHAGLRKLAAECDATACNIEVTKAAISSTFAQLEAKSAALQTINLEMKATLDASQSARSQIERLRLELKQEQILSTEKIHRKKSEVSDIPRKVQLTQDAKAAQLVKRTTLIEQLERKLEEARFELIQRQSALPVVQELTHQLEREWVEHHRLLCGFEKAQARTNAIREDLERTEKAVAEFEVRWPMKGKIKTKRGLPELESVYEEALIQNRQMADDHAALIDEITVLEEMNRILLAGLTA
jgi:hypothetical protein